MKAGIHPHYRKYDKTDKSKAEAEPEPSNS
jgi:hypothetical protein